MICVNHSAIDALFVSLKNQKTVKPNVALPICINPQSLVLHIKCRSCCCGRRNLPSKVGQGADFRGWIGAVEGGLAHPGTSGCSLCCQEQGLLDPSAAMLDILERVGGGVAGRTRGRQQKEGTELRVDSYLATKQNPFSYIVQCRRVLQH